VLSGRWVQAGTVNIQEDFDVNLNANWQNYEAEVEIVDGKLVLASDRSVGKANAKLTGNPPPDIVAEASVDLGDGPHLVRSVCIRARRQTSGSFPRPPVYAKVTAYKADRKSDTPTTVRLVVGVVGGQVSEPVYLEDVTTGSLRITLNGPLATASYGGQTTEAVTVDFAADDTLTLLRLELQGRSGSTGPSVESFDAPPVSPPPPPL
jgi:hypothetical protein